MYREENNKIPKKFQYIVAKMLVCTDVSNIGDIIRVKSSNDKYFAYNKRTMKTMLIPMSILANSHFVEIIDIIE